MSTSSKHYTITEYEGFVNEDKPMPGFENLPKGYTKIPGRIFDALESSILSYRHDKDTETIELP